MENWKAVPGFEGGYEVSDQGRVRSLDRYTTCKDGRKFFCKGKVLQPKPNVGGYPSLRLGRGNPVMVHQLVMLAFVGPANGRYACHNNGARDDNRLSNLRYDTGYGNQADRVLHGTETHGSMLPQAKLTESQVAEIKRKLPSSTSRALAREYGVSPGAVDLIRQGRNWRRVK